MKKAIILVMVLLSIVGLVGCNQKKGITSGKGTYNPDQSEELENTQKDSQKIVKETLFVLMQIDDKEKRMLFQRADERGQQFYYQYDDNTQIYDKYKKPVEFSTLEPGDVVVLTLNSKKKKVNTMTMAKHVWKMEQITDFSVKENGEIASFRGKNYAWSDQVGIFSKDQQLMLDELTRMDILQITGVDRRILSVKVGTGHGTIAFQNTEKFIGGYALFGNVLAVQIQKDMKIPVRAGTILFSVMKDGVGGSKEIKVEENQNMILDLEAFSKETISKAQVTFQLIQEDAKLYINGSLIDHTKPIELNYGGYQVKVKSEKYDSWTRTLMVGSPKSTIVIDLDEVKASKDNETTKDKATNNKTNTTTKPNQNSSAVTGTGSRITNGSSATNTNPSGNSTTNNSTSTKLIDDILNALLGVKEKSTTKTEN